MKPPNTGGWAVSHAAVPFLRTAASGDIELFFSSRDNQKRTSIGRAAVKFSSAENAASGEVAAVLGPGVLGAFDDSGATGSCLVAHEGREYLYYSGWALGRTVPFVLAIGLATSDDGGRTFERVSAGPIIGRTRAEPFLAGAPWVLIEDGRWRMWYTSGARWESAEEGPRHYYRIAYAESSDGIDWHPTGRICIDFKDEEEYALARPCVLRDAAGYRMWFSCRGSDYRIGYAESEDGLVWARRDGYGGLGPTGDGWESRAVAYGFVFDREGTRWMLYNGNGYGATGIGLARWEGGG
jgi:hypothetical protein